MKKLALAEVIDQPATGELVARISALEARNAALEARLEKLDPTPKREKLEPYPVGSSVYSISDLEGRHPLVVRGYDRHGHVLVTVLPGEPERELPLESVRPLEQCPRAQPNPSQKFANIADKKAREFLQGREEARIAAITAPFVPPIPKQERYGRTGTFTGGRMVYDE